MGAVEKKNARNSLVEILRVLCIFGILLMHDNKDLLHASESVGETIWIMLVNIFNFESSFLMLASAYYGNPYASRSRLTRLWMMVLFYSYFLFVLSAFQNRTMISMENVHLGSVVQQLLPVSSGSSWFAAGYILIWLLAPYLESVFDKISKTECIVMLSIMLTFFVVIPTFTTYGIISSYGKDVGTLLTFYMVGRYCKKYCVFDIKPLVVWKRLVIIGIVLQMVLNGGCIILWRYVLDNKGVILPFSWDHSFPELILSIGLIGITSKISFSNRIINYSGRHVFGILLSEGIVKICASSVVNNLGGASFGIRYLASSLGRIMIIMIGGLVLDSVREKVFNRFERKVISMTKRIHTRIENNLTMIN